MLIRFEGFGLFAEDPRLFVVAKVVYILFITRQGLRITPFDRFRPILLRLDSTETVIPEKNWAPFVVNDRIHLVYSYDPLVILQWDTNREGLLNLVYKDDAVEHVPFSSAKSILRG